VGHLPGFLRDRLGFLLRCAERYGPVVPLELGGHTLLITDADDIGHVLTTNDANYKKSPRITGAKGRALLGEGLLTSVGDQHHRRRRVMQRVFHARSVAVLAGTLAEAVEHQIAAWGTGTMIDMSREMTRLARRSIVQALFGPSFADEADTLDRAIETRQRYIAYYFRTLLHLSERLPTRFRKEYDGAMAYMGKVIAAEIAAHRLPVRRPPDLLTMLIETTYPDESRMSDAELRDELLTLFVTGHETLADAMSWTFYLLARHPDAEHAVRCEAREVLRGRPATQADLPQLGYTAMVLAESLRLYPPTWLYIRMAQADDRLPSGARVAAGTKIYLSPYVVHRNPRYYENPDRFDPLRFSEARAARPRFAYFPFGGGPHVCIGESLARMEGTIALATIVQRFSLRSLAHATVRAVPGMTLHPHGGLPMRVELAEEAS
jgi:cytochrome P450